MLARNDRHLSPAETARRLGVTVKALRLYEQHGLVKPVRTTADWRTYGPVEIARLHQVLALKRLGLTLAKIAELLNQRGAKLADVLALQEQALSGEGTRISHALSLIRAARAKLASGEELSIDDLTTLTKETTMATKFDPKEMKQIFDPIVAKHFTQEEIAETGRRKFDPEATQRNWENLITEAKTLMAKHADPGSAEAMDLAKRWMAQVAEFTRGDPQVHTKLNAVWGDAMADPKAAPKLPLNPEIFAFIGKANAKLKEKPGS